METAAGRAEQLAHNLFLAKLWYFPNIDLAALQVCWIGLFRWNKQNFLSYEDIKRSYWSQVHKVSLKITPVQSLILSASSDIVKKDLTENQSKTTGLLDFGITWLFKAFRFNLSLQNALNQDAYSYTIYDSINTYSYDYKLRGRELLFTLAITL